MFDPYWEDFHFSLWKVWARDTPGQFTDFYERNYAGKTDLNFLDIGCGTGGITEYLAKKGHNVVALDGSRLAIAKTKEIANERVTLVVGDVCNIEFKPETFDCLVDNCTLQTITDFDEFARTISTIRDWLKPGGRLYSKMATEPYNYVRKNAPVRLMKYEDLFSIKAGFAGTVWFERSVLVNGDEVHHYVLDFQKT